MQHMIIRTPVSLLKLLPDFHENWFLVSITNTCVANLILGCVAIQYKFYTSVICFNPPCSWVWEIFVYCGLRSSQYLTHHALEVYRGRKGETPYNIDAACRWMWSASRYGRFTTIDRAPGTRVVVYGSHTRRPGLCRVRRPCCNSNHRLCAHPWVYWVAVAGTWPNI